MASQREVASQPAYVASFWSLSARTSAAPGTICAVGASLKAACTADRSDVATRSSETVLGRATTRSEFLGSAPGFVGSSTRWSLRRSFSHPATPLRPSVPCQVEANLLAQTEDKMKKSIESAKTTFNSVRTGRASTALLDRIVVDYYGAETPLKQLASISTPDASSLLIQAYDKAAVPGIERAIMTSDLGLTPQTDGLSVRLSLPPLTTDRRKELMKTVTKLAESARVAVRNVRRDAIDNVRKREKGGELAKDLARDEEDKIQKLTDKYVKRVEELLAEKEKEIMVK